MKLRIIATIGLLLIGGYAQTVSAYAYEFSNHTEEPLKLRIKLAADPTWYEMLIEPHEMHEMLWLPVLHPREKESKDVWKAGFCLEEINVAVPLKDVVRVVSPEGEYMGTTEEIRKQNGKVVFGAWKNVSIEWLEDEGVNAMLSAAESFARNLQQTATGIMEAVSGK